MRIAIFLASVLLVMGCDGDDAADAGPGGGFDAGPNTGTDAGPNTGTDAGPNTGADAGPMTDAGPNTGVDAGPNTGSDAGATMSISGADPRPGYIGCGDVSCMQPEVCCVSLSGRMCTADSACGGGFFDAPGTCDGPEDCESGQSCCVRFEMFGSMNGAFCRDGATCPSSDDQLCHTNVDCAGGDTCVVCVPPGAADTRYGLCTSDGRCPAPYTSP